MRNQQLNRQAVERQDRFVVFLTWEELIKVKKRNLPKKRGNELSRVLVFRFRLSVGNLITMLYTLKEIRAYVCVRFLQRTRPGNLGPWGNV